VSEVLRRSAPRVFCRDDPVFPGHFPGMPIVPGVLLLEAVLDSANALIEGGPIFSGVERVKFLRPLGPDEEFAVELRDSAGPLLAFTCRAGDEAIATGWLRRQSDGQG
jgi:3-hydroxymyristoyl/3-hydroxydecanoyl-(acyl carrier protein) dehydratase